MSKYQCYQDGKPCSSYNIKGWENDTFDTFLEANRFCIHWAYPIGTDQINEFFQTMLLGKSYDFGISGVPVMMKIMGIEE